MNVAVCVKHAVDEGELRADPSGGPQLKGALSKMGSFDRNAVEEAVRVKESRGGTVTVFSLGGPDSKKTVKEALAMGCDKGVLVLSARQLDALSSSYFLSRALKRAGAFDLVFFAEGSSDTYQGLVGPMVARWLGMPFLGFARKVDVDSASVRVEVALEDRAESEETDLPAVISVVSEVNTPRYPTLLQIMQTSKKPLEEVNLESLADGNEPKAGVVVGAVAVQSVDRKRVVFEGPPEETASKLIEALRKEGAI
jgi:electron transfer flavoprotein beta subunit